MMNSNCFVVIPKFVNNKKDEYSFPSRLDISHMIRDYVNNLEESVLWQE